MAINYRRSFCTFWTIRIRPKSWWLCNIYDGVCSCLVADNSEFKDKIFFKEIEIKEGETILLCTDDLTDDLCLCKLEDIWGQNEDVLEYVEKVSDWSKGSFVLWGFVYYILFNLIDAMEKSYE